MKKITRRSFLAAAGLSVAALALTACGGSSSSVASSVASSAAASSEAASTSAAAGELTTVEAGKLTMATNATFPPYEMTTDSGVHSGSHTGFPYPVYEGCGIKRFYNPGALFLSVEVTPGRVVEIGSGQIICLLRGSRVGGALSGGSPCGKVYGVFIVEYFLQ